MIETQLLDLIGNGNQIAFRQLYIIYKDKVYNTALCYTQNIEDAEEITQDVFLSVFTSAKMFKGQSKVSTWIYKITINKAINQINKMKGKLSVNQQLKDDISTDFKHPGIILENKEKSEYLFSAINSLIESQKIAFILIYIEGLPQKEAAEIMECSVKSIESLIQRAKSNLRIKLDSIYPDRKK